jgi:LL-diaminopimelate aminotransferase
MAEQNLNLSSIIAPSASSIFITIEKKILALRQAGIDVFDYSILDHGIDIGIPDIALNINIKNYKYGGYPGNIGKKDFLHSVANYFNRNFKLNFNEETEINITNGTKTDEFIFTRALLNPGDLAICPRPAYPAFADSVKFCSGKMHVIHLTAENDWLLDFHSIPENVAKEAKCIFYNYPNSPTGASVTRAWLEEFVEWAKKHEIIIVSDEVYSDFIFDGREHISPLHISKEGVIGFFSLSKRSNMTSMRVGFAVGDSRLIAALRHIKTMHDDGVPQCIQDMAIAALNDETHVQIFKKGYSYCREQLANAFVKYFDCPRIDLSKHAGLFLWQRVPKTMNGVEFAEILLQNCAIVVIPGSVFADHCGNYIRIAMSSNEEFIDKTIEAMRIYGER